MRLPRCSAIWTGGFPAVQVVVSVLPKRHPANDSCWKASFFSDLVNLLFHVLVNNP